MGPRAGKCKWGVRAGKCKCGTRAGKCKLGDKAWARAKGKAKSQGLSRGYKRLVGECRLGPRLVNTNLGPGTVILESRPRLVTASGGPGPAGADWGPGIRGCRCPGDATL